MAKTMADKLAGAKTLNEAFAQRVELSAERAWLTLYKRDRITDTLTFRALHEGALLWAGSLKSSGVKHGDRVVMVLPTERAFYEAYLGILFAGAAPVPAYPPVRMSRLEEYQQTLAGQIHNCDAAAVITNDRIRPLVRPAADSGEKKVPLIVADGISGPGLAAPEVVGPDALGLIQYTSGSTGNQKGVMLSHANLIANVRGFGRAIDLGEEDVAVTWLPLYHDMGLIGLMLGSIYWGLPLVATSPIDFLRRPVRWLRMISKHGGTVSAGPNFAYSLVARKAKEEDLKELDLSTWRIALCGAEPIHPSTPERFNERFAKYGLNPTTFFPAYGLAENTLAVTFSIPGEAARITSFDPDALEIEGRAIPMEEAQGGKKLVSVGEPIDTVEVAIVNKSGKKLEEGMRGDVVVKGPSLMSGYYKNEKATRSTISKDGWLSTGDLGFCLDGHYYICGRKKDMVIKAGRNYFAEDIEAAAATVEGVRPGGLCVFSVDDPEKGVEQVVLVAETPEKRDGMAEEIMKSVSAATGCRPDKVVIVEPRTVPKTSSGKIQRFKARQWYLDGSLTTREGERRTTGLWVYIKAAVKDFFAK